MRTTHCPTAEQLADFSTGNLAVETVEEVAGHLETCPDCQQALHGLSPAHDPLLEELRGLSGNDAYIQEPECQEAVADFLAQYPMVSIRPAEEPTPSHPPR